MYAATLPPVATPSSDHFFPTMKELQLMAAVRHTIDAHVYCEVEPSGQRLPDWRGGDHGDLTLALRVTVLS